MNFEGARTLILDTLLSLVQYHIDELEDVAKNARRALRGMF